MKKNSFVAAVLLLFLGGNVLAQAQESFGDFGITGLLDMPTARMQDDGAFGFTYVRQALADTFALSYQATPWLETSFRYHIQSPREERWDYYDRSYGIKILLLEETPLLPQVSVGIQDVLGTGLYSGEYLVGSKGVGNLDLTLGLGWGRLAGRPIGRNPLTFVSNHFERRNTDFGLGGKLSGDYFFGPKVGLFGGLQYQIPEWRLSLVAEYNSDTYKREFSENSIDLESPWGIGLNWEPVKDVTVGVSWQHGSELALRLTSKLDSRNMLPRQQRPLKVTLEGDLISNDTNQAPPEWYSRMAYDAVQTDLWLRGATMVASDHVLLEYENDGYQLESDAAERILMLAELHLPPEIKTVTLVHVINNMRSFSIQYSRRQWSSVYEIARGGSEIRRSMIFLPTVEPTRPEIRTREAFQINTYANIKPRFSLFDPDDPARYQIYLGLNAFARIGEGWIARGGLALNLDTNFDEIDRSSDSILPHVRSDVDKYLKQGSSGLQYLYIDKHGQMDRDLYYRGFGGYLEEMYAGIGAEILYRPFRSRLAFGASLIGVRQRDFDKGLGLRDYQTTIGHLSVYWASPFYNYDVALHFGRYLAGDWGQTLEVKRRFANGWEVGAYATLTDVPEEDFGEGSFDKGIMIRIPLSALAQRESGRGAAAATTIGSLSRDGGQRLDPFGSSLWDTLRSSNYDELTLSERLNP